MFVLSEHQISANLKPKTLVEFIKNSTTIIKYLKIMISLSNVPFGYRPIL